DGAAPLHRSGPGPRRSGRGGSGPPIRTRSRSNRRCQPAAIRGISWLVLAAGDLRVAIFGPLPASYTAREPIASGRCAGARAAEGADDGAAVNHAGRALIAAPSW